MMKIKFPAFVTIFLFCCSFSLWGQRGNDTIPVTNSNIIKDYGRSIDFNAESKAQIQKNIRALVDTCLHTMILRDEYSNEYNPIVIEKFKTLFSEDILLKDYPIIPNFYQPRACNDTSVFPQYYSVQSYIDSIQRWFDYVEVFRESEIVANDYFYKFRGEIFTNALVSIDFSGPSRIACNGSIRESVQLNIWFTMSKQKVSYRSGVEVPIQYKIRFIEVKKITGEPAITTVKPVYKNKWGFLKLKLTGGYTNPTFTAQPGYENLTASAGETYGALASINLFACDTFTVFNKVRLWRYGFDVGIGFTHQSWNWNLDNYTDQVQTIQSPLHGLNFGSNYLLTTSGNSITQKVSVDMITVPVSFTLKRYFNNKKVNTIYFVAGASFNYLLGNSCEVQSGILSYKGEQCSFEDPQSGQWVENMTIENLPYYGFGNFDASYANTTENPFKSWYVSTQLKIGLDLRKDWYSPLHWLIATWFSYSVTDLSASLSDPVIIGPGGALADLSAACTSIKPVSFGIEFGIAYNFLQNNMKNIKAWKNKSQKKASAPPEKSSKHNDNE